MSVDRLDASIESLRLTRRRLLVLAGGTAATGLLASSGIAHADPRGVGAERMAQAVAAVTAASAPAPAAAAPLAAFQQSTQTGFVPVNSTLTFGAPSDIAAGWDGTLWAIDERGAPHRYDPLSNTWQLHGSGVDGAALINDTGPAVYFRGGELFTADGSASGPRTLAQVWPNLPPSYQLGVQGAAWAAGKVVLFRSGTYLTVPWSSSSATAGDAVYHAAMQPEVTATPTVRPSAPAATATPDRTATPSAVRTPVASPTSAPTASSTPTSTPTGPADYVAAPLASIDGWPQSGPWQAGVIDGVFSMGNGLVLIVHGGECIPVSFQPGVAPTANPPRPLSDLASLSAYLPADWLANGFDGFVVQQGAEQQQFFVMHGPQAMVYSTDGPAQSSSLHYLPEIVGPDGWPASWNPRFLQAPSGRTSGLWGATVEGHVVSFDGTAWTQQPGDASSVGVGADGSVFAVGHQNPTQLSQWDGNAWNLVATHSAPLAQVSVGNQSLVWTRDGGNAVRQLNQGQLQSVPNLASAAHLAANHDGTVWSCNGAAPQASRFASDLGVVPTSVPAPGPVQKVASTGFGTAHCLVGSGPGATGQGATIQRYESPYLFRTPGSYVVGASTAFEVGAEPIEQGLGSLFFVVMSPPPAAPGNYQLVALDAQTGQELSRSAVAAAGLRYTAPVFDAIHETVIVGLTAAPGASKQTGRLLGLDARDLSQQRWSITLPNNLSLGPGRPTLAGSQLCVSDNTNTLVMYDTGMAPNATPSSTPVWTYSFATAPQDDHCLPPPVLANGQVTAAWWLFSNTDGFLQLWLWKLDASTGSVVQTTAVDASPGYRYLPHPNDLEWGLMGQFPPLLATLPGAQAGQTRQVLFVNGGSSVGGIDVKANTVQYYDLPGNQGAADAPNVASGFGFADGVLWFGDNFASLYGVDGQLKIVPNTPAQMSTASNTARIAATPVPYTDSQGQSAVLVGVMLGGNPGLLAFDPSSGNVASIPTAGTSLASLSKTVSNGIIYAGGSYTGSGTQPGNQAQVFGIQVDDAIQSLRAFVIDSQLMQDFDDPSQPTHNANGVARYQTHVTLVDDQKSPLANEAVKLWADQPNTMLLVNGQNYTIGPDDDQYAAVKTGTDGTLLIVSGYTQADSSDTPDMSAPPLRAWASFMDPYERMLIYRDREFHNRVTTTHAATSGQSGADDPTKVNLQSAQKYGDLQNQGKAPSSQTSLFTDDEKQQGQPQNVANAIQKMTASVGTAPPAGSKTLKASFLLHATDTPGKYIPYSDTPGAQYSPVNVAANRAAVVLQTGGLSYSSNNDSSAPSAYSSMTPSEAMLAIDALDGVPWHTSQYATARVKSAAATGKLSLGGFFDDFWSWIKGAVATITHIIVSVAEDIYTGIRFIINGVAHVFQAIITGIEEVASAIGAFFIELGKIIEEIIEALSILFQFGHIMDTHNVLKAELLRRVNGDGSTAYPGFARALQISVQQPLDGFFETGEQAINNTFDALANQIAGATQTGGVALGGLKGAGATSHSTFTVQPQGGGAPAPSSPQCTWGTQKLQAGLGGGSANVSASSRLTGLRATTGDPLEAFVTGFLNRLTDDADLNAQWAKVQAGAGNLGNASSPSDFARQGVAELVRTIALLLDGALAVSNAFMDGFLGVAGDLIDALFNAQSGVLNQPLDIPVLSWLYNLLFGEPLTVINAITLVAAIPITLIWRVAKGQWPADSFSASPAAAVSSVVVEIMGIMGGLGEIIYGIICGIADASSMFSKYIQGTGDILKQLLAYFSVGLSMVMSAVSFPLLATTSTPSGLSWAGWGVNLAISPICMLGLPPFTVLQSLSAAQKELLPQIVGGVVSVLNLTVLALAITGYVEQGGSNLANNLDFAATIFSTIPGILNPLTNFGVEAALFVAVLDVVLGLAAGALMIAGAVESASPASLAPSRSSADKPVWA